MSNLNRKIKIIEGVYSEQYKSLLGYGYAMVGDMVKVEDAIHDLFLKLYVDSNNLETVKDKKAYLLRALKNRLLDERRSFGGKKVVYNQPSNYFNATDEMVHDDFQKDDDELLKELKLKKNLNSLTNKQREVLYLRYIENLSYANIALMLKIEEQTAKNLKTRAISKLRELIRVMLVMGS